MDSTISVLIIITTFAFIVVLIMRWFGLDEPEDK